ncbi:MAG: NAD(P)-binding protein [bacterium]|nr:NAD(P)-binding protein [bacterium]
MSPEASSPLEADYLVIGGGAMGIAFADEILHRSKTARVVVVERRAKPGGHWNSAYRFVTLHQPALYYGVNSEPLGEDERDLVSQAQILAYYERVLKKLERTGRFTFLPKCEVGEDSVIRAIASGGDEIAVRAKKTVDATYMDVRVPSTTPPKYETSSGATLVPINGLADLERGYARYVVIGAGKTGIDAALYLLERGVDPAKITWIMPNDAWFLNREALYPDGLADEFGTQLEILQDAQSLTDVMQRLEAAGRLLRLDGDVWPTKYRCATVNEAELANLRRIADVDRSGRVERIEGSKIVFASSERSFDEAVDDLLYVDCSADGLAQRPPRPIWDGDRITLQSVSMCQQVMSAAAIAALELAEPDDTRKNETFRPVPHPLLPPDFLRCTQTTIQNQERSVSKLGLWAFRARLSAVHHMGFFGILRFVWRVWRNPVPDDERLAVLIEAG